MDILNIDNIIESLRVEIAECKQDIETFKREVKDIISSNFKKIIKLIEDNN